MLRNTFLHIPGIGAITEKRLWDSGVTSWDAFVEPYPVRLSPNRIESLRRYLDESRIHFQNVNPNYFIELLPSNLQWRLFPEFRHSTAYLDIETTGMDGYYNDITMIGLYDGTSIYHYVKGQNLDDFRADIEKYKVIVTYNGKCFDLPFIRSNMGIAMNHTHIDLRYVLGSVGFSGGLKGCETQAGIERGELTGLDGYDAVLLWNDYKRNGSQKALETLLAYNSQDIVNLEVLMVLGYNLKLKDTPFWGTSQLRDPVVPEIPFKGDLETIERIKIEKMNTFSGYGYW
ncbi:MAG: ribonuclease H-like domain-containing protein [Desulfobacterales bacterium]|nr:ribonuclease H-like domain-containing protein [Desulfobacterales bacterium]